MSFQEKTSHLKKNPKSKVLKPGYINIYSNLNKKEKRQIEYKIAYKNENKDWDETQVFLSKKFGELGNKNSIVLDAGCGHGNYVIDENRKNINWAVGVDIKPEYTSKNICLDEIFHNDLEKLPFEGSEFDIVVSLWVLEHLKNPDQVFKEVHRVLKPGGLFMFCTPNKNFIPLKFVQLVKNSKVNFFLNKYLFGRKSQDVFEAFYKANTLGDIKNLSGDLFEIVALKYNYDPSYTSFNDLSFKFFGGLHRFMAKFGIKVTFAHIIGIVRKK